MLVLRDRRPERQGEGGLRVALTLCDLAQLAKRTSPTGDVYAVSHGRAATRDEQHCKAAANRRDRYSLSDWKALRGRIGT